MPISKPMFQPDGFLPQDDDSFELPDDISPYLGHIPYDTILSMFNSGFTEFLELEEIDNAETFQGDSRPVFEECFISLLRQYNQLNIRPDIGLFLASKNIHLTDEEVLMAKNDPDIFLGELNNTLQLKDAGYVYTTGYEVINELYLTLKPKFIKYLMLKYRFNMQEAEDICQDVFIKVLTRMPKKVKIFPWLQRVLDNKAKDAYRKRRNRRTYTFTDTRYRIGSEDELENSLEALFQDSFEDEVIARLSVNPRIYPAFMTLSPAQKRLFYLVFIQELSISEVATILGKSYSAVNMGLTRVRRNMMIELSKDID